MVTYIHSCLPQIFNEMFDIFSPQWSGEHKSEKDKDASVEEHVACRKLKYLKDKQRLIYGPVAIGAWLGSWPVQLLQVWAANGTHLSPLPDAHWGYLTGNTLHHTSYPWLPARETD